MKLSPMRYKDYVWPHNPKTYEISFERKVAVSKVPFGRYCMQDVGMTYRVLRGEGEFAGRGAYDEFKKLATVFYDGTPGILAHPVWQPSKAYFVKLKLMQEPREDYVSYSFEFWEDYEGLASTATQVKTVVETPEGTRTSAEIHTVVKGDTLWAIANKYGMTLEKLLSYNPQIKNPNLIYPGDRIRLSEGAK